MQWPEQETQPQGTKPLQMSFFKNSYEASESGTNNYLKIAPNETATVRIISAPLEGLEVWDDKKPLRWPMNDPAPDRVNELDERPKPFAALGVWHYESGSSKIYMCSTKSVLLDMQQIIEVEGHPFEYDLVIMRKGAGLSTRWFVKPGARTEADAGIQKAAEYFRTSVDLTKLFTNDNPFTQPKNVLTNEPAKNSSTPF